MAETTQISRRGQSKEQRVVHNALITPSVSPPPPPRSARVTSAYRPLPKRQRISPFSSSPQQSRRASSSSSNPGAIDPTLGEALRLSSRKPVHVWESLLERYYTPLDQDYIYDLRTEYSEPEDAEGDAYDGTQTEAEETDEEVDPIDSIAENPVVSWESWRVPPFRADDPGDAKDLKEFLEEERRRLEKGSEDAHEDEDAGAWEDEEEEEGEEESSSRRAGSLQQERLAMRTSPSLERQLRPKLSTQKGVAEPALTTADTDSEDELATCEPDDSTPVRSTTRPPSRASSSEGMTGTRTPSRATSRFAGLAIQCSTDDISRHSSPETSWRDRAKSAPSPHCLVTTLARPTIRNIQLQTPPRSHTASSVGEGTPVHRCSPAISKPVSARRPQTSRAQSSPIASSSRTAHPPRAENFATPREDKPPYLPKHSLEVVPPMRCTRKQSPPALQLDVQPEAPSPQKSSPVRKTTELPPRPKKKYAPPIFLYDFSDSELPSPAPTRRTTTPQIPMARSIPVKQYRKRKRSSTSSELKMSPDQSPKLGPSVRVDQERRSPSEPPRRTTTATRRGKARATYSDSDSERSDTIRRGRGQVFTRSRSSDRRFDESSSPPPRLPVFPHPTSYYENIPKQRHPLHPLPPPIQDLLARDGIAQALEYLSCLVSGGARQPTPALHPYPPQWAKTPSHRSRSRTRAREHSSSPPQIPSPNVPYSTPGHRYSHSYEAAYSSGTSPPMSSSPAPSSSPTSHYYPASRIDKRSKSRGRRVSFKLDSDDNRHPRYARRDEDSDSRSRRAMPPPSYVPTHQQRPRHKHSSRNEPSSDDDSGSRPRGERGRTPGPSPRRTAS